VLFRSEEMLSYTQIVKLLSRQGHEMSAAERKDIISRSLVALPVQTNSSTKLHYPAFQIDQKRGCIFSQVQKVNEILDAGNDPWGAASWWISTHLRIGTAPKNLLGTQKAPHLVSLAESIRDDSY